MRKEKQKNQKDRKLKKTCKFDPGKMKEFGVLLLGFGLRSSSASQPYSYFLKWMQSSRVTKVCFPTPSPTLPLELGSDALLTSPRLALGAYFINWGGLVTEGGG